jgi:hypothetical protein
VPCTTHLQHLPPAERFIQLVNSATFTERLGQLVVASFIDKILTLLEQQLHRGGAEVSSSSLLLSWPGQLYLLACLPASACLPAASCTLMPCRQVADNAEPPLQSSASTLLSEAPL